MQNLEQALVSFFARVARKDPHELQRLAREPRFCMEEGQWRFTLPDLHAFLQAHDAVFRPIDYKRFRKALYASPINQSIRPLGAEVIIADNRSKVDQSNYALVWRVREDG